MCAMNDGLFEFSFRKITEIIDRKDATQERVLTAAIKDPALEGISEK